LSNANAALVSAVIAASQTHSASLRMRSSSSRVVPVARDLSRASIRIVDAIKPELPAHCMLK
jgi:hypothetical protein